MPFFPHILTPSCLDNAIMDVKDFSDNPFSSASSLLRSKLESAAPSPSASFIEGIKDANAALSTQQEKEGSLTEEAKSTLLLHEKLLIAYTKDLNTWLDPEKAWDLFKNFQQCAILDPVAKGKWKEIPEHSPSLKAVVEASGLFLCWLVDKIKSPSTDVRLVYQCYVQLGTVAWLRMRLEDDEALRDHWTLHIKRYVDRMNTVDPEAEKTTLAIAADMFEDCGLDLLCKTNGLGTSRKESSLQDN